MLTSKNTNLQSIWISLNQFQLMLSFCLLQEHIPQGYIDSLKGFRYSIGNFGIVSETLQTTDDKLEDAIGSPEKTFGEFGRIGFDSISILINYNPVFIILSIVIIFHIILYIIIR